MNATLFSSYLALKQPPPSKNRTIVESHIVNPPYKHSPILHNHGMEMYDPDSHNGINSSSSSSQNRHHNSSSNNQSSAEKEIVIDVTIERKDEHEPWGFRLQGGKDYHTQLTITSVKAGSPSGEKLHKGDVVLKINGFRTPDLSHSDAIELIKCAREKLDLEVQRTTSKISIISPLKIINFGAAFNH